MRKILTTDQFDALAGEFGVEDVTLYSGRGMYGKQSLGYQGDDLGAFIVALAFTLHEDEWTDGELYVAEVGSVVGELLQVASRDSMGLGEIHYWRTIQVEGSQLEGRF